MTPIGSPYLDAKNINEDASMTDELKSFDWRQWIIDSGQTVNQVLAGRALSLTIRLSDPPDPIDHKERLRAEFVRNDWFDPEFNPMGGIARRAVQAEP